VADGDACRGRAHHHHLQPLPWHLAYHAGPESPAGKPDSAAQKENPKRQGIQPLEVVRRLFDPETAVRVWDDPRHFTANLPAASTAMRLGELQLGSENCRFLGVTRPSSAMRLLPGGSGIGFGREGGAVRSVCSWAAPTRVRRVNGPGLPFSFMVPSRVSGGHAHGNGLPEGPPLSATIPRNRSLAGRAPRGGFSTPGWRGLCLGWRGVSGFAGRAPSLPYQAIQAAIRFDKWRDDA
jgi:hypothetical protein